MVEETYILDSGVVMDRHALVVEEMSLRWLEAVLPLGIIAGFLCVMGNAQYFIHKAAHGRPKHIGNDMWDVAMERRDKKMMEMLASPSSSSS